MKVLIKSDCILDCGNTCVDLIPLDVSVGWLRTRDRRVNSLESRQGSDMTGCVELSATRLENAIRSSPAMILTRNHMVIRKDRNSSVDQGDETPECSDDDVSTGDDSRSDVVVEILYL